MIELGSREPRTKNCSNHSGQCNAADTKILNHEEEFSCLKGFHVSVTFSLVNMSLSKKFWVHSISKSRIFILVGAISLK